MTTPQTAATEALTTPQTTALTMALIALADEGQRPRCGDASDRDMWISDDAKDREQAAAWCVGCPVLAQCGAAAEAENERHGVWAGVDRTPKPKRSVGAARAEAAA